eukprot:scaffold207_cov409-Prasinococcus_capsulatus_cf.AAC.127
MPAAACQVSHRSFLWRGLHYHGRMSRCNDQVAGATLYVAIQTRGKSEVRAWATSIERFMKRWRSPSSAICGVCCCSVR